MTASPVRRRLRSKTAPACVRIVQRKSEFKIKERTGDYIVVQALDAKELQLLLAHLKRKRPRPAKMKNEGAGDSDDERKARYADRDSCISWFNIEAECPFVHQRLKKLVREGNNHWPIIKVDGRGELLCTYEDTQYAVYGPGQHFNAWHQDAFAKGNDPEDARQMTVVLMLSERGAYTGGEFQAKVKMPIRKVWDKEDSGLLGFRCLAEESFGGTDLIGAMEWSAEVVMHMMVHKEATEEAAAGPPPSSVELDVPKVQRMYTPVNYRVTGPATQAEKVAGPAPVTWRPDLNREMDRRRRGSREEDAETVTAVNAHSYFQDPDSNPAVTVHFRLPDGSTKEVVFKQRPWGIDFTKSVPVTVKRVRSNSHAGLLGVQVDWVALKVGGNEMPDEFVEAMQIIQKH
ncbi:unnamed protein product, partial [Effrenium voratum]